MRNRLQRLTACLIAFLGSIALAACGTSSSGDQTLSPPSAATVGAFVAALDGDLVVIGADGDAFNGENAGAAYIYQNTGASWAAVDRLSASDASVDARFGIEVAVDEDAGVIAVATLDEVGALSGSVYVFRFNGTAWIEEQTLLPDDSTEAQIFTGAIAVDGDEIVVGAREDATGIGHVYVYRHDGMSWLHEQTVTPADPALAPLFGTSLDLDGDVLAVGAWASAGAGALSGSAIVYRFDTTQYVVEQTLTASDAASGDTFGFSLAVDDDAIVVGAKFDNDGGEETGSAYVYRYVTDTWIEEEKLTALDPEPGQRFGSDVDISGDVVAVAAVLADSSPQDAFAGAVYVFRDDGMNWVQEQRLTDNGRVGGELFGTSVSIDGDVIATGTFDAINTVIMHVFDDPDWIEDALLEGL